jgi:hypothetical protein
MTFSHVQHLLTAMDHLLVDPNPVNEAKLANVEAQQADFAALVLEIALNASVAEAQRQLAALLLKKHIDAKWTSESEKFQGPHEVPMEVKVHVKTMLLEHALHVASPKIRTALALAIAHIAQFDWPEAWPGLFERLVSCLKSDQVHTVDGAMQVLAGMSSMLNALP